jgi:tetratricopeptide (TPR) repeat protein
MQVVFRDTGADPAVIELPAISTGQHRLELYRASLRGFAPALTAQGYVRPEGEPSPERLRQIEAGAGYSRPLAIQIDALLWLASAAPEAGATGVDGLLRQMLGLERGHWKKLISSLDDERTRDLARGVAQVTAVQGVPSPASTERLLMADDFYQGQRTARVAVDPVVRALSRLYGKPDGGIGHLEPDLIGEHHVAVVGDTDLIDGCLRWIETEPAGTWGKRRRDLVTVLQRASQPEHGASANDRAVALLDHLISRHVRTLAAEMVGVMIDTRGALAQRLDQKIDTMEAESLGAVDAALPIQSLSLMDLSLRVAVRRADLARQRLPGAGLEAADQHEWALNHLAACVGTLGIRLSNLGRREEALAASQEAVDIRRRLAQTRPDAFLPDLASSLNNLGIRLSNLGRREEALAASQEAVDIRRRLAQTRPDAFLPDLASSLNNAGAMLSNLGRREEALAASQEAVDLYRRLAQTRPDAFLPDLASSLSVTSDILASLDRRVEAAQVAHQALECLAPFVERYPAAYGELARVIAADVLRYSEAAAQAPNMELLERVARALSSHAGGESRS